MHLQTKRAAGKQTAVPSRERWFCGGMTFRKRVVVRSSEGSEVRERALRSGRNSRAALLELELAHSTLAAEPDQSSFRSVRTYARRCRARSLRIILQTTNVGARTRSVSPRTPVPLRLQPRRYVQQQCAHAAGGERDPVDIIMSPPAGEEQKGPRRC